MNTIRTAALALLLCGCSLTPHSDYGTPLTLDDSAAIEVGEVLAAPTDYDGKFLRMSGVVTEVCAKKGCWLRMSGSGDAKNVFVKFAAGCDKYVGLDAAGRVALVEGDLVIEEVGVEELKHLLEDAGRTEEAAKVTKPEIRTRFVATGAAIRKR